MGVKSLWNLLEPVGRPVLLETMEGKAMAIDSSIWIYQFQATMRDKEGRGLVNAHVLGFLRRITKLLFYGIKPVFVFDGGAPALKRSTIAERKNKKSGAAASHAKVAERLLAAHMRREALNHAQASSSSSNKKGPPSGPVVIDENTVYLEDLDSNAPKTPARPVRKETENTPPSSKKKHWHDHDPYRLPDVNMDEMVAQATRSNAPDPRLATEDELRSFIEEMRPEDFDVASSAFRDLPTEVQYEIIGDLRLKSRQTSYKRLQNMLKKAKTPLDFSKEQIKNLKQRNSLTQQLLTTTDSIGKAHVEIPIRIASERNKQYILVKNEGEAGGWILGVRDEGTRAKPIEIDQDPKPEPKPEPKDDEDSDMDMEEVTIPVQSVIDPDLHEHRRKEALSAVAARYTPKRLAPLTTKPARKPSKPLFTPEDTKLLEEDDGVLVEDELDPEILTAIQESLEEQEAAELRRAIEASRVSTSRTARFTEIPGSNVGASSSRQTLDGVAPQTPAKVADDVQIHQDARDSDDDLYASPTRLETALSIANAGPKPRTPPKESKEPSPTDDLDFGIPTLLVPSGSNTAEARSPEPVAAEDSEEDDMEEVAVPATLMSSATLGASAARFEKEIPVSPPADSDDDMEEVAVSAPLPSTIALDPSTTRMGKETPVSLPVRSDEEDMEDVLPTLVEPPSSSVPLNPILPIAASPKSQPHLVSRSDPISIASTAQPSQLPEENRTSELPQSAADPEANSSDESDEEKWSRPASPTANPDAAKAPQSAKADEDWDAAQEMDPQAEESEYAQFISQVRGRNLEDVRREIDDEIRTLNEQKKIAMRDSEDITQQMISQIMMMLRLFGIPYITAPMEAEAQCAELLSLNLVDGIITDDSDVFLFGGLRVLKNMFNQSKTVECFLLSDLERELSLDREKLIRLAYLLGSDYTEGLPGVGPVVAMELLTEFAGPDGLRQFRDWWRKVQSGQDTPEDTKSKFRKRFKKRFKDLYLPEDWPNASVRDAYYHPTVDSSDEPFKWGLPDLDALRQFFHTELGWAAEKVDDLLLPIIHKMGKRNQAGNVNRQGNLNTFFDVPAGAGAPRKRQAYTSKRLQQVVADFRKQQALKTASSSSSGNVSESESEVDDTGRPKKKRKPSKNSEGASERSASRGGRGARGRGRGRGGGTARKKRAVKKSSASESDGSSDGEPLAQAGSSAVPPPRKLPPRPRPVYKQAATDNGDD